jgi:hypothetical protein
MTAIGRRRDHIGEGPRAINPELPARRHARWLSRVWNWRHFCLYRAIRELVEVDFYDLAVSTKSRLSILCFTSLTEEIV